MRKGILIMGVLMGIGWNSLGQRGHGVVLDVGGIGGYGALSYEVVFWEKIPFEVSGKVGFSFYRWRDYERKWNPDLLFPVSVQTRWKWKQHQAVMGIGQTISSIVQADVDFEKERKFGWNGSVILGYGFQQLNSPWRFQLLYTPLWEHYNRWRHWGGLSVGFIF